MDKLILNIDRNVHAMPASIRAQLVAHIQFYAELLYRVGLQDLRNEVLKITNELPLEVQFNTLERNHLGESWMHLYHLLRAVLTWNSYFSFVSRLFHGGSR